MALRASTNCKIGSRGSDPNGARITDTVGLNGKKDRHRISGVIAESVRNRTPSESPNDARLSQCRKTFKFATSAIGTICYGKAIVVGVDLAASWGGVGIRRQNDAGPLERAG